MTDTLAIAGVAIPVSLIIAAITSVITVHLQRQFLERNFKLDYSVEAVVRKLLSDERFPKKQRSFARIKDHLGGFDDNEDALRRILLQAGAVRFFGKNSIGEKDPKKEYWALIENADLGA